MKTVDVGQVLDEGNWSGYQKLLIFGAALTIVLDGIDNQLLGNAVSTLMTDWNLPRSAFTTPFGGVLALSPVGMMIGGAIGGMLGDRIGRRNTLMFCVVAFAVFTLCISSVNTVAMLGVLRFLSGLGLGGAMPNAAALASEYVPRRKRPFAVTLTIVCIPLGGTIAGYLSGAVLPNWRTLFVLGGTIPLVLAAVLFQVLPESPRFMARHRDRWPELIRMLRRLGHVVPDDATFFETATERQVHKKASIRDLFKGGLAFDTIGLFGAFFFGLLGNYVAIFLLPSTLTAAGFAPGAASNALGSWNLGGVMGAIIGALVIQRLGSRTTMLTMSALAIVCAFVLMNSRIEPSNVMTLTMMFILTGGLVNGVQTTMYALAAHVYPTEIRGTGIGSAVAVGRIGNVLAAYTGAFALDAGGVSGYFSTFALTMGATLICLALVRRHIAPTTNREELRSAA